AAPLGCAGIVDGGAAGPMGDGTFGPDDPDVVPDDRPPTPPGIDPVELPEARAWRLTPTQYVNSFTHAFGASSLTADVFPPDGEREGFKNSSDQLVVSEEVARLYHDNAVAMAAALAPKLKDEFGCFSSTAADDACVTTIVSEYATKAFRRPATPDEVTRLVAVFRAVEADFDTLEAAKALLETIAQSPSFLYRSELGDDREGEDTRLTGHEIASQLAYLLTDAPPDEELLAAAAADELHNKAVVREHAERLLATPAAREKFGTFIAEYVQIASLASGSLDKNGEYSLSPDLQKDLLRETMEFARTVVFDEDDSLANLFSAPFSMMNAAVAEHYGVDESLGSDFERVELTDGIRGGLMTQPSVMAAWGKASDTDPLHRGLFVYNRIL
ncbi:MAG: DUF1592 domain-containing protein, partial [Myxococcales bacterium]|nr:DUF1592 domain-containing protein [Myxococcales bacterium]